MHQKKKLENELKKAPTGKLIYSKTGQYVKWFQSIDGKKHYIQKANVAFAKQLAYKRYLELRLKELDRAYQAEREGISYKVGEEYELFMKNEVYFDLIKDKEIFSLDDQWMNGDYERNNFFKENLVHKTVGNLYVRSKSESLIAIALAENKIPFRYEQKVTFGMIDIYPDFTIRKPSTGEVIYWEHFGMMDDVNYSRDFAKKIATYSNAGVVPGKNLIMSFETSSEPLTYDAITKLIRIWFE